MGNSYHNAIPETPQQLDQTEQYVFILKLGGRASTRYRELKHDTIADHIMLVRTRIGTKTVLTSIRCEIRSTWCKS